jgi:hypothetical protein
MVINVQTLAILLLGGLLLLQGTLSIGELLATNVLIMFVTVSRWGWPGVGWGPLGCLWVAQRLVHGMGWRFLPGGDHLASV